LTSLPVNIGKLTNLISLDLSSHQIENIPISIGNMSSLTALDLRNNQLASLPESISNLSNLVSLSVSNNTLNYLPNHIDRLSNLESLDIGGNLFSSLPDRFENLKQLDYLDLSNNRFTELPTAIVELTNLKSLYLDGNKITSLPTMISQLTKLETLSLSDNPLTDLSIARSLTNLKTLLFLGVELPERYWIELSQWQPQWLLDEENTEIRRALIEYIGYDRICQELQAVTIDSWREYTLLKIDRIEPIFEDIHEGMPIDPRIVVVDLEPMVLLKMTCPSTAHIHILRVPPEMTRAEVAITWVNHGIHPDEFAIQT
jgi:leucine-rich repeat protein SHOC2